MHWELSFLTTAVNVQLSREEHQLKRNSSLMLVTPGAVELGWHTWVCVSLTGPQVWPPHQQHHYWEHQLGMHLLRPHRTYEVSNSGGRALQSVSTSLPGDSAVRARVWELPILSPLCSEGPKDHRKGRDPYGVGKALRNKTKARPWASGLPVQDFFHWAVRDVITFTWPSAFS